MHWLKAIVPPMVVQWCVWGMLLVVVGALHKNTPKQTNFCASGISAQKFRVVALGFSTGLVGWVYTIVMGMARNTASTRSRRRRARYRATEYSGGPKLGPWGVYGEAIGNPKFYIGANPKDSEFLQAADEFAASHEELLRELAKY